MSTQGRIWNKLTNTETLEEFGIYGACLTKNETVTDNIFCEMCEKYAATLSKAQANAFYNIIDLASMVGCWGHDRGVAEGLMLAREIRVLLDNPAEAMQQGTLLCNYPHEANKCEIDALRAYFEEGKP